MQSVFTCAGLGEDEGHAALSERLQQQALEVRRGLLLALAIQRLLSYLCSLHGLLKQASGSLQLEPLEPLQAIWMAEEELVAGNGAGAAKDCSQGGAS